MCDKCSSGKSDYEHGRAVGWNRELNDTVPGRADNDPNYYGESERESYDSGRSGSYRDGVSAGRDSVRNSR
jgi:hypothetical protein